MSCLLVAFSEVIHIFGLQLILTLVYRMMGHAICCTFAQSLNIVIWKKVCARSRFDMNTSVKDAHSSREESGLGIRWLRIPIYKDNADIAIKAR